MYISWPDQKCTVARIMYHRNLIQEIKYHLYHIAYDELMGDSYLIQESNGNFKNEWQTLDSFISKFLCNFKSHHLYKDSILEILDQQYCRLLVLFIIAPLWKKFLRKNIQEIIWPKPKKVSTIHIFQDNI